MGRVARNRSRNSKLECENSKTNSMANNDEPPNLSKTAERSNERSRKSPTNPRKTRRTCPESKTWSTNFKSRSKPTNDNPKNPKKLPTPTSANTESSNTNLTKQKNEPTWPNLPSTSSDPKPDPTRFNEDEHSHSEFSFFGQFKSLIQKNK